MQRNLIKFIEQLEKKMNNLKFLLFVVIIFCSFLWTSVDGSLSNSRMTSPSPPRNLRRSTVGVIGDREYHIFWTASSDTGGSAVNYSVKICRLNDSSVENNSCKWSSKPQCMPTNITCTTKKFSCILDKKPDYYLAYNYTLCVVASNAVGNSESCISAPIIRSGLATPRPPLDFSASIDTERSGSIKVRWRERGAWYYRDTVYTIQYHAEGQPNKTKEVANKTTFTVLSSLKPFMIYCIYIVVQTVADNGLRSAPSNVLGPICLKTPAGNPDKPPMVEWDQSVVFPDNAALRNVTVGWKLAKNSSWRGTPHEYHIYCNYHLLNAHPPAAKKCEYHIDAASNRAVLQKLNTADSYNVYIEMWNKEGKQSVPGDTYIVKELQDNSTQLTATEQGKLSSTQIGLIVGSVLIGLATAGISLFLFRKWWQERNDTTLTQGRLDERLHLGNPSGNVYALPDSEVQHQYSQLNIDVHGENV